MDISEIPQSAGSATVEAWPKVDLGFLDDRHATPPAFPLDVLPPFWRSWAQGATARSGAPSDYVALSLLTATASLIPGRWVMPAPGWSEPCILWTALVGPPSCGKTPAVESACRLLNRVWYQRCRGPQNPDGPVTPEPMLTNGTSIGAILDKMDEAAPRGLLLVRDDNGGWLAHMARGTRDGSAHAFWLSAWCLRNLEFGWRGKTLELDRQSLSILGTTHPDTLLPALNRDDGGVLARFLFVRPGAAAPWEPLTRADAIASEAVAALRRLYEQPWEMRDLSLTGEALAAFDRFRQEHRAPMPDLAGKAAAWWGKGPSQVLRLAGVLTFLHWAAQPQGTAEPDQVPARALESAVRLWRDYLWPHAQATFRIAGAGGERESRERQVLRWIRAQRLPEVSREQIRREALQQAVDAAGANRLIAELVEAGWLRLVEPAKGGRGRRRRRWLVHPDLWEAKDPAMSGTVNARALDGSDRVAPATLMASIAEKERRWSDAVRPVTGDTNVPHRHREETEDDLAVPRAAVSAIPASVLVGARHSSGASSEAQAEGDLVPPDVAVSAIPASEFEDQVPLAAQAGHDAVPAVSAIPAGDFGPSTVSPSPATRHELPGRVSEDVSAIRASESDIATVTVPPVTGADNPTTAAATVIATAGDDGVPPPLNARTRRRLRRLEKFAHLRSGVEPTLRGVAA